MCSFVSIYLHTYLYTNKNAFNINRRQDTILQLALFFSIKFTDLYKAEHFLLNAYWWFLSFSVTYFFIIFAYFLLNSFFFFVCINSYIDTLWTPTFCYILHMLHRSIFHHIHLTQVSVSLPARWGWHCLCKTVEESSENCMPSTKHYAWHSVIIR